MQIEVAERLFRQNHKVRTVEDLYKISLEPPTSLIRPVVDPYLTNWSVDNLDWTKAWTAYSYTRAQQAVYTPWGTDFKHWFDRLRFKMHVKLIQWKVLI